MKRLFNYHVTIIIILSLLIYSQLAPAQEPPQEELELIPLVDDAGAAQLETESVTAQADGEGFGLSNFHWYTNPALVSSEFIGQGLTLTFSANVEDLGNNVSWRFLSPVIESSGDRRGLQRGDDRDTFGIASWTLEQDPDTLEYFWRFRSGIFGYATEPAGTPDDDGNLPPIGLGVFVYIDGHSAAKLPGRWEVRITETIAATGITVARLGAGVSADPNFDPENRFFILRGHLLRPAGDEAPYRSVPGEEHSLAVQSFYTEFDIAQSPPASMGPPKQNVAITWGLSQPSGSYGSVNPTSSTTDANGVAETLLTVGTVPGSYYVGATGRNASNAEGFSTWLQFDVTYSPTDPVLAVPYEELDEDFVVKIEVIKEDGSRIPAVDIPVTFAITTRPNKRAGGSLRAYDTTTDDQGIATTRFTTGSATGIYVVTAASPGLNPMEFIAATVDEVVLYVDPVQSDEVYQPNYPSGFGAPLRFPQRHRRILTAMGVSYGEDGKRGDGTRDAPAGSGDDLVLGPVQVDWEFANKPGINSPNRGHAVLIDPQTGKLLGFKDTLIMQEFAEVQALGKAGECTLNTVYQALRITDKHPVTVIGLFDHPELCNCANDEPYPWFDGTLAHSEAKETRPANWDLSNMNFQNGEESFDVVDLAIPGRGDISFEWRRTYRSRVQFNGRIGYNWDFTYNERIIVDLDAPVVAPDTHSSLYRVNGFGRCDRWDFSLYTNAFQRRGFFGSIFHEADDSYSLREPNGFKRVYRQGTVDPRVYPLAEYQDRNGNTMQFLYDADGNLATILDPFGRQVELFYETFSDQKQKLVRIRDFFGREVVYTYDANFDLVAVRSPVVMGTSTGNDFPNGRTERYTYLSGFADSGAAVGGFSPTLLNHNIASRTLPEEVSRGGPPTYTWTYGEDPFDPVTFDRILTRTQGGTNHTGIDAGGTTTLSYAALQPGPIWDLALNDRTTRKTTTVTDRNGNVTIYEFNGRRQNIRVRQLTRGLHPGEPSEYVTENFYENRDNQLIRRIFPEGNELQITYQNQVPPPGEPPGGNSPRVTQANVIEERRIAGPRGGGEDLVKTMTYEPNFQFLATVTEERGNASDFTPPIGQASPSRYTAHHFYDSRGNRIRTEAPSVWLLPGSNEAQRLGTTTQTIVTETEWNSRGQPTRTIDPEGNVTLFTYYAENDPDGDGTPIPGQTSTAPFGYLKSTVIDAEGVALETVLAYDPVGNVTWARDPRGVVTTTEFNQLNEPVVTTRGADVSEAVASGQLITGEAPYAYAVRSFYDFNGRVVKTEVENRDGTDAGPGGVGAYVETFMSYDILNNLVESAIEADASNTVVTQQRYDANQNLVLVIQHEGNRVQTLYDERDLPYVTTRGEGTAAASTTRFDYDGNENLVKETDAEDNDGNGQPEVTTYLYDGFDRRIRSIDALGNETVNTYDPASNVVRVQVYGHPAGQPGAANVLLSDTTTSFDELNRAFQTDQALFVPQGFSPTRTPQLLDGNSDGLVTSRTEYDALGRITFTVEDDGQVSQTVYDGASRPIETIDALGNRVQTTYDRNSNPLTVTSIEVSPEGLVPNEIFVARNVYDQLNRLVRTTDNAGQTMRFQYDSRDNLVFQSDPEGPLTADPLGLYPGQINGPGNTRTFYFDGLDRNTRVVADLRVGGTGAGALDTSNPDNPDGQVSLTYLWDGNSRQTGIVDDNGNQTTYQYDALDRLIRQINAKTDEVTTWVFDRDDNIRQVTDPNGTVATKVYDALNRLTSVSVARAPGVGGTTWEGFEYDGLGRMTRASDDNGGTPQVCDYVFDSLGRLLEERQNGQPVSSVYTGDGKRMKSTLPGGRVLQSTFDAIDRVKTISDAGGAIATADWIGPGLRELRRQNANGTSLTFVDGGSDVGYDAVKRIVQLRVLGPSGTPVSRGYTYNRADMRTSEVRFDDSGLTDSYTYDSTYRVIASALDQGAGVKRDVQSLEYQYDGVGNRRMVDTFSQSAGAQSETYTVNAVNEYTSKGGIPRSHSRNGNLMDDGQRTYLYDYKNRLVGVSDSASGDPVAAYLYYWDNRRASKETNAGTTRFFYDGWQVCEEQDAAGATLSTYVYSPVFIDEPVQIQRTVAHPLGEGEVYLHQNVRADVVAVTDAAGNVIERRFYDDFGNAFDENKLPILASAVGNPYSFQGRRLDPETGLYYFRNRYYSTGTGRFLQRDPVWNAENFGGQYSFAWNGPVSRVDPEGLQGGNPRKCWPDNTDPADVDITQDYLHSQDYYLLKQKAPTKLTQFYKGYLDRHSEKISKAAKRNKIPGWLLAGVLLGEATNMDSSYGPFSESTLESFGFGKSVGLAQITVATANRRGLVPLDPKLQPPCTPAGYDAWVRSQLQKDEISIEASAKYLSQLLKEAVKASKCTGPQPSNQFGTYDWKSFTGDFDKLAMSMKELKQAPAGTDLRHTARMNLVGFFGAAHNDDRAVGQYARKSGLGEGTWARQAYEDLVRTGLMTQYGLDQPSERRRGD